MNTDMIAGRIDPSNIDIDRFIISLMKSAVLFSKRPTMISRWTVNGVTKKKLAVTIKIKTKILNNISMMSCIAIVDAKKGCAGLNLTTLFKNF